MRQPNVGLAAVIKELRDALPMTRLSGATSDIQLMVESMTIDFNVVATRAHGRKASRATSQIVLRRGPHAHLHPPAVSC